MTLTELKYAIALAKYKHFKKAAEHCFVSQPTLSVAIKKLEEELNLTLFERQKQTVLITPIGQQIITLAQEILLKTKEISNLSQTLNHSLIEIKIGAIYTIGPYLFPKIIPLLHKTFPTIKFIIEENYTHILNEQLQQGELDIIFISLPFYEKSIETQLLYQEDFVAAMSPTHELSNQSTINLKNIQEETILLLGSGHCFRDQVLEAYPNLKQSASNLQWHQILEGSSLETIKYMVASGTGLTILPKTSTLQTNILTIKPLTKPIPNRSVVMAWRKSFYQKSFIQKITHLIQSTHLEGTY